MEIFCRVPTLNLDAGSELPAIKRDDLSRDSQPLNRLKKTSNFITVKKFHDGIKSLYANKFPYDPRIRNLIYFKILSDFFRVILLKGARLVFA